MRLTAYLYVFFVLFCLKAKAQIDTTLLAALRNNDLTAVQLSLQRNININAKDNNAANALTWAVYYCDVPIVQYLVNHGAKVSDSAIIFPPKDREHFNSVQGMAAFKGKLQLLKYLIDSLRLPIDEKGFSPGTFRKEDLTPLSYASEIGHTEIAKYLVQNGAKIDAMDGDGTSTSLILAAERWHWEIFELLVQTEAYQKKVEEALPNLMDTLNWLKQPFTTKRAKELAVLQFCLQLRKIFFGQSSLPFATGLNKLARCYDDAGDYEKSRQLFHEAITLLKKLSLATHPEYIFSLNHLGVTYYNTGEYEKGMPFLEEAQQLLDNLYTPECELKHVTTETSCRMKAAHMRSFNLTMQAIFYGRWGKYDKSLAKYVKALSLGKKGLGEQHNFCVWISNNLAFLYSMMGLHKEAIPMYEKALSSKREIAGEDNDGVAGNLLDIGYAYIQTGQYKEALSSFEEASQMMKRSFGVKHQYYAMTVDGQASIYEHIGEYGKAISFYKQAFAIYKEAFNETHPYCATVLNNLASLYISIGEYNKALPLYQQALSIRKKSLKEEHADYAQSLANLASVYVYKAQYDTALLMYNQALAITAKAVGEEHEYYAACLTNLASLFTRMEKHDTALHLNQQALHIRRKVLGKAHPDNVNLLNTIGLASDRMKRDSLLIEACHIQLKNLSHTYSTLSEGEKMTFLNRRSSSFSYLPSLLYLQPKSSSSLLQQSYQNELSLKGMVLEDQKQIFASIRNSDDKTVIALYDQWRFNKTFLGKQLLLPVTERTSYFDSLQEVTNGMEQQLSRVSSAFKIQTGTQNITVSDIATKLKKAEAAIEFISFPYYNKKWRDSIVYAALVLLPGDSSPLFISLCEEKQLMHLLQTPANTEAAYAIQKIYPGNKKNQPDLIYQLIWKPLEKYLPGITTIYLAPAGLLHRIAFQALKDDNARLLINKYQLRQVLSTRSVVTTTETSKPLTASLWGNIQYSISTDTNALRINPTKHHTIENKNSSSFNFYASDTRNLRGGEWTLLPQTKKEVEAIKKIVRGKDINLKIVEDKAASEETFKGMDGKSPHVLHMATHGFFLPTGSTEKNATNTTNSFTLQQNPMFRSGLVLAGGNSAWKGETLMEGKEDGILTAYEIAQLDLSNTALTVLSACETALGDLQANEGVIGLQRALKMAGVKQMIVSLWRVPDKETVYLMTLFYSYWLNGLSTRDALRKAQLKMKEKYTPFYWAAFVLIE